ncbi:hypothetical protein D3C79_763240 [compost metagenome]
MQVRANRNNGEANRLIDGQPPRGLAASCQSPPGTSTLTVTGCCSNSFGSPQIMPPIEPWPSAPRRASSKPGSRSSPAVLSKRSISATIETLPQYSCTPLWPLRNTGRR